MSANIRIDQGSGAGVGTDGQARTNIWMSQLVELLDVGVGVPVSSLWTLDDKPAGSAATMLNPTTSTASFTPDVVGTYKVTLTRDGSVTGANVKTLVIRVTRSNVGAALTNIYPLPAFRERAEHSDGIAGQGTAGRGYSPLFDSITTTVALSAIRRDLYYGVAGVQEVDSNVSTGVGCIILDPSILPGDAGGITRTIVFETVISATVGMTAEVRLWNITDGALVTGTTMTTALNNPTEATSATLVVPTQLPNGKRIYEVQLRISAGTPVPGNRAICSMARLSVGWQ